MDEQPLPRDEALPPPPDWEDKTVQRLQARGLLRVSGGAGRPRSVRAAAAAAALLFSFAAGWFVRSADDAVHPEQPTHLLLLRGTPAMAQLERGADELRRVYAAWFEEHRERMVGGAPLAFAGVELAVEGEGPRARPWQAGAGLLSGYFLLRASSDAEAEALAASCPHLGYGGRATLRPLLNAERPR